MYFALINSRKRYCYKLVGGKICIIIIIAELVEPC